jgi:membrane protein YdbS with pleckstrin-like domain
MAMSDSSPASDVLWEGSPWVTPGLVGVSAEALAAVTFLTWFELAVLNVGSIYVVAATFLVVAALWLVGVARLELLKASNHYALKQSSLEIQHGIVGKRTFTVSAAGFSDLEVTKTLAGRVLNVGDIVVETNSDRDIGLTRVRDPMKVASMIGQVMTVPTVRVSQGPGPSPPASAARPD